MKKIILNLAVSLDGFIATIEGNVDWLNDIDMGDSDGGFVEFLEQVDSIIMGSSSYLTTMKLGKNDWPFKGHKSYVFTKRQIEQSNYAEFIDSDVEEFIRKLKEQEGKNIWLFGGGQFIQTVRELNLVDEYFISIIPKLIGNGISLFSKTINKNTLALQSVNKRNDVVQLHYKVIDNFPLL